jgi:hypothetical protein
LGRPRATEIAWGSDRSLPAESGRRICRRPGISRHSFLDQVARVELRSAELAASTLVGAAELALQPLLDDPRLVLWSHPPT